MPENSKKEVIKKQVEIVNALIQEYRDEYNLRDIILNHPFPENKKLKIASIKLVIEQLERSGESPELIRTIKEILVTRQIGKLKTDKKYLTIEEVEGGSSVNKKVKKEHKDTVIIQKIKVKDLSDVGEATNPGVFALEYLASQIAPIVGLDSPKVWFNKDKKKVTLMSTFRKEEFKPVVSFNDNLSIKSSAESLKDPKAMGIFFSKNALIADEDPSYSNTDINLKRIDFGAALSYSANKKITIQEYIDSLKFKFPEMYSEELFGKKEFFNSILEHVKTIDLKLIKFGIDLSLKEIEKAYGKNIYQNEQFIEECKRRLRIKAEITPKSISEIIIRSIEERKNELEEFANSKLKQIESLDIPLNKKPETLSEEAKIKNTREESSREKAKRKLDELEKIFQDTNLANTKTNADKIAKIKKEDNAKFSLLKYAFYTGRTDLAKKMNEAGFTLNKKESNDVDLDKIINNSNNLYRRLIRKSFTKNDLVRKDLIKNLSKEDLEKIELSREHLKGIDLSEEDKKRIDLSKKPSPLFVAIETGQLSKARELLKQGFRLKKSELEIYKVIDKNKLKSFKYYFFGKEEKSKKVIEEQVNKINNDLLKSGKSRISKNR